MTKQVSAVNGSKDPEAAIAERIAFLDRVTKFAIAITRERGRHLLTDGKTHRIDELRDFGHFSFRADTGQPSNDGSDVQIWYHYGTPCPKEGEGDPPGLVLDIHWEKAGFRDRTCTIAKFEPDTVWQRKLKTVIDTRASIAAAIDARSTSSERRALERRAQDQKQQEIRELARRLHIT